MLQNVQRDVVAAASSLLPRAHVVVNREPRKGALEARCPACVASAHTLLFSMTG